MKQHERTADQRMRASDPRRLHGDSRHEGISKLHDAYIVENAPAIRAKRAHAHLTDGTWHDTAFARIAPVFAPYHQRPKDAAT